MESSQRGAYYDVAFGPAPSLNALASAAPELSAPELAARFTRELAMQAAPYWASGSVTMPALDGIAGPVLVAPAPATSRIRYSCGVTLISPSYAITAGHCPTADTKLDELELQMYRPTQQLSQTWTKSEPLSGKWPALHHPQLEASDGYLIDEYSCQLLSRCYSGDFNCKNPGSDVAVMKCEGRPGEKYGFLNVSTADEKGHEALIHWKHEVLDLGDPVPSDYVDHYVRYADGAVNNFHYFESENQLLPLRSIPWPDGSSPLFLSNDDVDVYGCHGTSGSGILARQGSSVEYRLVGPVALGSQSFGNNLCQHVPNPGGAPAGPGIVGMSANLLQPQALLDQFQSALTQDCQERHEPERDVTGLPFAPGSYRPFTVFSHLKCQPDAFARDGSVAQDPSFGPYPERFTDDARTAEALLTGFVLEANADYRLAFQAQALGDCDACELPELRLGPGAAEPLTPQLVGKRALLTKTFAAPAAGPLEIGIKNSRTRLALGGFTLLREGQVNSFDAFEERLEAGLYALDASGDVRVGPVPMRFSGDGSAGFEALLLPGERMALLRQALAPARRWSVRLGAPSFADLSCGLLGLDGEPVTKQPCSAFLQVDDHLGAEPRLAFYVELSALSARASAAITYVALASDQARDPDGDAVPDVLDNCPGDWNAAQADCSEEPPVVAPGEGGAGGDDAAGGAAEGGAPDGNATGGTAGAFSENGGSAPSASGGANGGASLAGSSGIGGGGAAAVGGGAAGNAGPAGNGSSASAPATASDPGCSCRVPRGTRPPGAPLLALAMLLGLSRRRTARGSAERSRPCRARARRR